MQTTTYTFPPQTTLAGVLEFTVEASNGEYDIVEIPSTFSSVQTINYFSSELKIENLTEDVGGDITSSFADFTIDDDVSNLFFDTIFSVFSTYRGFVRITVELDSKVMFKGNVIPTTISCETYTATDDALSNARRRVTFRCGWIFDLMKTMSGEEFADFIMFTASTQYYQNLPQVIDQSATETSHRLYKWISVANILRASLAMFTYRYGTPISLVISKIDLNFWTKDGSGNSDSFVYPPRTGQGNSTVINGYTGGKDSLNLESIGVGYTYSNGVYNGSFKADDTTYQPTVYDFFVGILKSFGIQAIITHDPSTSVTIGNRTSGSPVVPIDILSQEDTPISDLSRDGVDVSSISCGNQYKTSFKSVGESEYSDQVILDFGNNLDFPGGYIDTYVANSRLSLNTPVKSLAGRDCLALIRACGIGKNLISNGDFETDLTGWDLGTSNCVWSSHNIGFGDGTASFELNTAGVPQEIQYTLDEAITDYLILSLQSTVERSTSIPPTSIKLRFYLKNGSYRDSTFYPQDSETVLFFHANDFAGRLYAPITKIGIIVTCDATDAGNFLYIDSIKLYRYRSNCTHLVGYLIEDLFNSGYLSQKRYTMNGIVKMNVGDHFTSDSEEFYIRKVSWDMSENETEIEAINYPY